MRTLLGICCALACAVGAGLAGTASAAQQVKLGVHLSPEHLGKGTTIEFSIEISAPGKLVPSPLSELDFRYPAKIGLLQSGLGRANCTAAALESLGKGGCPANALMGFGSALLEIQVGREIVREAGAISIWMGPVAGEELQLLFYASAATPASEQLVFGGLLEEAGPPFGGSLDTRLPPIPWNPEAPPASIVRFIARIGPRNVTYYRRTGGHDIPYRPEGLRLPHSCPRGGFPFAGTFAFIDGTTSTAQTSVPCPPTLGLPGRPGPHAALARSAHAPIDGYAACGVSPGLHMCRPARRRMRRLEQHQSGHHTARRPAKALPKVTSSAYSRSEPTGRPLARRVTVR